MKIGIIGGSISGCSAAILLNRAGYKTTIFERSTGSLQGRGGGIGTPSSLMKELKSEGLLEADFPSFGVEKMPFIKKDYAAGNSGKIIYTIPISFDVFRWNTLWRNLRKKIPDQDYHSGTEIIAATVKSNKKIELKTAKGEKDSFDIVLFADGYASIGRKLLFPDARLNYRGYILWRGLYPEHETNKISEIDNSIIRLTYEQEPGHNVVYYIPSEDGSKKAGSRQINWAAYVAISPEELDKIMTDAQDNIREGTIPPGMLDTENEKHLKEKITGQLPKDFAQIIDDTRNSYIQVIYTADIPAYSKNRIGLIGDAGIVAQPFTGSGVFKGYHNARNLIKHLNATDDLDHALQRWSEEELNNGRKLLKLGDQMEKAFIWDQTKINKMTKEEIKQWWSDSVTFPDHFNYNK